MGGYLGSYLYQVDEKGRVTMPAAFRRGQNDSFVLVQFHGDALTLIPNENWREVEAGLREMLKRKPDARHFLLRLTANAHEVTPDKQGRVLIPERLRSSAGISSEVQIVGAFDKIEIWDPRRFEEATSSGDEVADEWSKLAAEIFA
jgi:MraZ protein